ncbi:transglycosylase SLT domain-containing protein [Bradyrhizobium sp. SYSU BS000235]|uniref:transglycosylase SLT domain-containing protein n=1 Tax=Bradyrhizobium sp. SYSU BS000235 TaxID=3411332 RepID=UPI003C738BC7
MSVSIAWADDDKPATAPVAPPAATSDSSKPAEVPKPADESQPAEVSKPAASKPASDGQSAPQSKTPAESAPAPPPAKDAKNVDTREAMCLMIESAASAHGLPLEFFARVIWQESRFQPDAVGPMTRNGQRAQGVAQFMPGTASERRLLDPFDPVQALPKSAEFLAELKEQFGNLGLAAAAYNAGPRRVQEWIAGTGYMPSETRNYVYAITGSTVEEWSAAGRNGIAKERKPPAGCRELMAMLKTAPNPFIAELEHRVVLGAAMPWGVQLAAGFSRDNALAMYARSMKHLSSIIGDRDPSLISSIFRSRGTRPFYQVRIGTDTRPAANDLCNQIRRAGQACIVLKNGRG